MNRWTRFCLTIYRRLARAYPLEFRMLHGEELDSAGEDAVPEVWARYGMAGLVALLMDIALQLPVRYLAEIRQDAAYALRRFGASPGLPCVAVLSLAIGIGMCCAVLSQLHAFLGSPPGIPEPGSLVATREPVAYPYFERYRDMRQRDFQVAAVVTMVPFALAPAGDHTVKSERVRGHLVSPEYFSTLGLKPLAGEVLQYGVGEAGDGARGGGERAVLAEAARREAECGGRDAAAEWPCGDHSRRRSRKVPGYLAGDSGRCDRSSHVRRRAGARTSGRPPPPPRSGDFSSGAKARTGHTHRRGRGCPRD